MHEPKRSDWISPESLRLIAEIARKGSMAAAARGLNIVPSAVTYRVRQIEDALDVLLFDRSVKRAILTPAGRALLEDGERVLQELDAIAQRVRRVALGWEPELRIAVDSLISHRTVLELCEAFYTAGPNGQAPPTRLRIDRETLTGTWHSLQDGRCDLALGVVAEGTLPTGVLVKPLGEAEFAFAVAPHHPLAGLTEPLADDVIRQHRIVAVADSTRRSQGAATVGILAGQDVLTVSTMADKLLAQLRGLGCGYVPLCMAQPYLTAGQLVAKRTQRTARISKVGYAWRRPPRGAEPKALNWWLTQLQSSATLDALMTKH